MTTEGIAMQNPTPAPAASNEPSQPFHSVPQPSQPESEAVAVEKAREGAHDNYTEAPNPQPPSAPSTEPILPQAGASSEPSAPVDAQTEEAKAKNILNEEPKKDEPHPGEKRDLDLTTAPALVPGPAAASATEGKKEPIPETTEPEPALKKQKLEAEPESTRQPNGPTEPSSDAPAKPAATDDTNGNSKKAGHPKKDKVKEAVKKVIPTDGIGSRTRSRTKAT